MHTNFAYITNVETAQSFRVFRQNAIRRFASLPQGTVGRRSSQSEAAVLSRERFDLETQNSTETSLPVVSRTTPDTTSLAASGQKLATFETRRKMAYPTTSTYIITKYDTCIHTGCVTNCFRSAAKKQIKYCTKVRKLV